MSEIQFFVGNDRPDLKGTLSFTGEPLLAAATVNITVADINKPNTKAIDSQPCEVTIKEETIDWTYHIQSGDFETPGTYEVFLTITFADDDVMDVKADGVVKVSERFD